MIKFKNILIFSLFLLLSCDEDYSFKGVDVNIIEITSFEEINSDEWFEVKKYIPLNAKNASDYLYAVGKIRFANDCIYILQTDGDGRTIFKFSSDGRMLGSVNGPSSIEKKFYGVTDFITTKNGLVLNDRSQRELIYFDFDLNYVKSDMVSFVNGLQNIYIYI